jgi:cathepsin B
MKFIIIAAIVALSFATYTLHSEEEGVFGSLSNEEFA